MVMSLYCQVKSYLILPFLELIITLIFYCCSFLWIYHYTKYVFPPAEIQQNFPTKFFQPSLWRFFRMFKQIPKFISPMWPWSPHPPWPAPVGGLVSVSLCTCMASLCCSAMFHFLHSYFLEWVLDLISPKYPLTRPPPSPFFISFYFGSLPGKLVSFIK